MPLNTDTAVDPYTSPQPLSSHPEMTRELAISTTSSGGANTDYEAANALAALASLGSAAPYAPVHDHLPKLQTSPTYAHQPPHTIPTALNDGSNTSYKLEPAQPMELSYGRYEQSTSQIRQPSPAQKLIGQDSVSGQDCLISPSDIKPEPSMTPRAFTPSAVVTQSGLAEETSMDTDTPRVLAELKSENGLRGNRETTASTTADARKPTPTPSVPSKRRGGPKSTGASGKKGPSARKPPTKRRKLDVDTASANSGSNDRRSGTPSSRASKTPALAGRGHKKSQSGTPVLGSSPAPGDVPASSEADESDSDDDNSLYCICRGKDDHTWMIGCEACDDWFHGRCVNLKKEEHEMLLAKFICPNCEQAGHGHTTWKPMCRRDGCSKPAASITETKLVDGKKVEVLTKSKYCSNECGVNFFKNVIAVVSLTTGTGGSLSKRRLSGKRKANALGQNGNMEFSDDDDYEPPPRGGVLRARDLKSLVTASENVELFHRLGSGFLSPSAASATDGEIGEQLYTLTDAENARLSELVAEKTRLRARHALLRDRERFITIARESSNRYAEKEGMKPKEVCGYDTRLAWSEEEFMAWRTSKIGRASLDASTFEPSEDDITKAETEDVANVNETAQMNIDIEAIQASVSQPCPRKRCERHKAWEKLHLHDIRFGGMEVVQALRKCDNEEKDIRDKAMVRWRREKAEEGLKDQDMDSKRRGEGWVEVIA